MAPTLDRKFLPAAVATVLAFAALLALGAHAISRMEQGLEAVDHRHEVHMQLRAVELGLLELDVQRLGPAGAPDAAAQRQRAEQALDRHLARLGELVEPHAAQHPDYELLRILAGRQPRAGAEATTDAAVRGTEIRAALSRLAAEETSELDQHRVALDVDLARVTGLTIAVAAGGALLLTAFALVLRRERASAERAERAEAAATAELERRVDERTRQLTSTAGALERSEARLRRLLRLLPEAVLVVRDGRVGLANEAMQRLAGKDEAALVGRPPQALFHPDSCAAVASRLAALASGPALATPLAEERIPRDDGSVRTVEAAAARIADDDGLSIVIVLRDVTELRRVQAELMRSHADLRRLLAAQEGVREDERRRIARELHDDLQQTLAAIRVDVSTAAAHIAADAAEAAKILTGVDQLAGAALVSTRRIVNDLRPRLLDDLGLLPALELLAEQFSQRSGVACSVDAVAGDCEAAVAAPAVATCLYRVAQEALNNVAKHANARSVALELECLGNGKVALRVRDDGRGIADTDRGKPESVGLLGMHERVRALGGTLAVHAAPGAGTTVEAVVPARAAVVRDAPVAVGG